MQGSTSSLNETRLDTFISKMKNFFLFFKKNSFQSIKNCNNLQYFFFKMSSRCDVLNHYDFEFHQKTNLLFSPKREF